MIRKINGNLVWSEYNLGNSSINLEQRNLSSHILHLYTLMSVNKFYYCLQLENIFSWCLLRLKKL